MSSYLQKHNQKLETRSKSIEGGRENRESHNNPGYMKFLEENISKFNQREGDFDKMQMKLLDVQTKLDKLLSQENKLATESSILNRAFGRMDDKMKSLEGLTERVEYFEKQSLGRFVGRLSLGLP